MEDVVFGLSHYQLIGIILSNVYPIELCILIARFLKLSDFENSRKSYLEDYLRYDKIVPEKKKENMDPIIRYMWITHARWQKNKPKLFPSFNLRPYLNDSGFGQKYDSVIKQLKTFMNDYEFKNSLQIGPFMEVAPYLLSRSRQGRSNYGYLEGDNGMWFTFHNQIQNTIPEVAINEVISNTIEMNKQEAKRMIKKSKKKKKALKDIHGDFTKKNVKKRLSKENKKMNRMSYKNSCR